MHERIKSMWPSIIKILLANGHSQKSLADKVGVNQSTICRLADGEGPEPRWSVGAALIELAGGRAVLRDVHALDVESFLRSSAGLADRRDPLRAHPFPDLDRRTSTAIAGEG